MDDDKPRISITLTAEQSIRFTRLLGELKARRAIPQTTTVNKLLLLLATERADQIERGEPAQAKPRKKS